MARPAPKYPTELELEILKVLWRDGPLIGREVRDRLAGFRDLAYTSVMTIMSIMEEKGYLRRKKEGKAYIYSPRVSEDATKKRMLGDIVKRVYEGSTLAAMVNLLETSDIDAEELQQLRELIKKKTERVTSFPFSTNFERDRGRLQICGA